MIERRLAKLRAKLRELDVDAIIIASSINRRYLSNFTGSAGVLLLTHSDNILVTDFRYREQAPQQATAYTVIEHQGMIVNRLAELVATNGIKTLAFEQEHVTYAEYRMWDSLFTATELVPTNGIVEHIRIVKDEQELAIIQTAARMADDAFEHILSYIRPGITERDVALELEFFMRKQGATSTSFETIVASGERSALPHGIASERVIGNNEFVKLDYGAYYEGYCSDLTRTIVVGTPTAKHVEIYNVVAQAQQTALDNIRPGMTGREADAFAREVIQQAGYGDLFGHGTGHGIGMEIHEAPRLSPMSDQVLEPGMVVTVEPGIYIAGFGGVRIEDDIVITDSGISVLTHAPKSLICI